MVLLFLCVRGRIVTLPYNLNAQRKYIFLLSNTASQAHSQLVGKEKMLSVQIRASLYIKPNIGVYVD